MMRDVAAATSQARAPRDRATSGSAEYEPARMAGVHRTVAFACASSRKFPWGEYVIGRPTQLGHRGDALRVDGRLQQFEQSTVRLVQPAPRESARHPAGHPAARG